MIHKIKIEESRLLILTCFLFLIFYVMVGFYNRLSHDDLAYLHGVSIDGIIQSTVKNFNSWNTRWAGVLTANFFFSFITIDSGLLWFHLLSLLCLAIAFFQLIHSLLLWNKDLRFSFQQKTIMGLCFCMLLFVTTFSIGDVWFWVNASCMYLWNITAFVWGFSFAIRPGRNIFRMLFISLCALYVGGSSEPFAIINILLLALFAGYLSTQKKFRTINQNIFLFLVILLISFLISCMGKGMALRSSALPHPDFISSQFIFFKSILKFFVLYFPTRLLLAVAFSFPFFLAGVATKNSVSIKLNFVSLTKVVFIFFLLLTAANFYIVTYKMGEAGPERAWTAISFYLTLAIAVLAFVAGNKGYFQNLFQLKKIILTAICTVVIAYGINQYIVLKQYAVTYDLRINSLLKLKQNNHTQKVSLQPLSPSGILHSGEITADSNNFTNFQLKQFLQLPFTVVLDTTNKSVL